MLVFKVVLLLIAVYSVVVSLFLKNNIMNLKDLLLGYIHNSDFDEWFVSKFCNNYIIQNIVILIITILALC